MTTEQLRKLIREEARKSKRLSEMPVSRTRRVADSPNDPLYGWAFEQFFDLKSAMDLRNLSQVISLADSMDLDMTGRGQAGTVVKITFFGPKDMLVKFIKSQPKDYDARQGIGIDEFINSIYKV